MPFLKHIGILGCTVNSHVQNIVLNSLRIWKILLGERAKDHIYNLKYAFWCGNFSDTSVMRISKVWCLWERWCLRFTAASKEYPDSSLRVKYGDSDYLWNVGTTYQTTRPHNPKDGCLRCQGRENPKRPMQLTNLLLIWYLIFLFFFKIRARPKLWLTLFILFKIFIFFSLPFLRPELDIRVPNT